MWRCEEEVPTIQHLLDSNAPLIPSLHRDVVQAGTKLCPSSFVFPSVSDPDPCGSVLKWLPWIRIRIGNTDPDPDPGQSIWCPKREKNL